ncbi:hypothetical protein [Halalkalibacter oceani]|uniref:hypothetical protein n=1 Tax=Halalkalibacter oceani TaxID=1653776 RepID=UPI003391316F
MSKVNVEDITVKRYRYGDSLPALNTGREQVDHIYKHYISILEQQQRAISNMFYLNSECVGFCILLTDRISKSATKVFLGGSYPTFFPAIQLYCIGVKKEYQSSGIGSSIMDWILYTVNEMRNNVGISFLVLESYNDEKLLEFYRSNEFVKWKYVIDPPEDLIPLVYDFRGLEGDI